MAAIAGIAEKGRRDDVSAMLQKLNHRVKGSPVVTECDNGTLGFIKKGTEQVPSLDSGDAGAQAYLSNGVLCLRRDPLGIEPLYYGRTKEGTLCFASEVKALLNLTRDVYEVPPGSEYDGQDFRHRHVLERQLPLSDPPQAIARELRRRLELEVERSISSKTMGSWLSGGLDSSSVVALARPYLNTVHTFAAGLPGAPDLEAARIVADFLKTEHHEIVVSEKELVRLLPEIIYHLESFDALLVRSSLMNYMAGKVAAQYVEDIFSGEGADELFAGYEYLKAIPVSELPDELIDITLRLHNTALQRVDRCSSAHALTAHLPFLAPSVVEFALKVPAELKLHGTIEKWILRQSMDGLLPPEIAERPKAKFWQGAGVGDLLQTYAGQIPDSDFENERKLPNGWLLASKEELMYYRVFRDCFGPLTELSWMGRTKGAS